jgi:hypothetical protein
VVALVGGRIPSPEMLSVDLWPDLSEFDQSELCPTGMALPSGASAFVFSSERAATVRRHFRCMRDYGIDGAATQRFVSQIANPGFLARANIVLHNIRLAAEAEGRGFFVVYDLSDLKNDQGEAIIERDWTQLRQTERLTSSRSYIHHRGRPVVGLSEFGVSNRKVSTAMAGALVRFSVTRQRSRFLGGVAAHSRAIRAESPSGRMSIDRSISSARGQLAASGRRPTLMPSRTTSWRRISAKHGHEAKTTCQCSSRASLGTTSDMAQPHSIRFQGVAAPFTEGRQQRHALRRDNALHCYV